MLKNSLKTGSLVSQIDSIVVVIFTDTIYLKRKLNVKDTATTCFNVYLQHLLMKILLKRF